MRFILRPSGHGYPTVIEATVQRTRPVVLTALAAWLRLKPAADEIQEAWTEEPELGAAMAAE